MPTEALDADQRANVSIGGKPSYTIDQAAAQLDRAGLSWSGALGQPTVVTYAYRSSAPASMPDDTSGFQRFDFFQIQASESALKAWGAVANVQFVRVGSGTNGDAAYSNDATILFGDYSSGESGAAAFAYLPGNRASASPDGDVWVNTSLDENHDLGEGGYGYLTLLHEIGHTIGLVHPSDYNAGESEAPLHYSTDASYYEDSLEYTVMSYFAAASTGSTIETARHAPAGPLIDDVAAAQRLYGVNLNTNAGDTAYSDQTSAHQVIWQTIWDGGGDDSITAWSTAAPEKIDLKPGSFSDLDGYIGNLSIAAGAVIENAIGGTGDDMIIGNDADNILNGNSGNDRLVGGAADDTYVGGAGNDVAILPGNVGDYRLIDGGSGGLILVSATSHVWIDPSTETVQFANGQYLALHDVSAYVASVGVQGAVIMAPATNPFSGGSGAIYETGGAGFDTLYLDANVSDYRLSRVQNYDHTGDFELLNTHSNEALIVGEAIDRVQLLDGQYLALQDLPAYIAGDPALFDGGDQNDLLYQTRDNYQTFYGGAGTDDLFLRGNVWDYRLVNFEGRADGDHTISGVMLVNAAGDDGLVVDSSVETVHFQNGQYLAFRDIPAYVAPATNVVAGTMQVIGEAAMHGSGGLNVYGSGSTDTLDLNGGFSDYAVSRDGVGGIELTGSRLFYDLDPMMDYVHFSDNNRYVSFGSLDNYLGGNSTAISGTVGDDMIFAGSGGDQYLLGGAGVDNAYLHGNTHDYTLAVVSGIATPYGTTLTGVELIATNHTGNIYIDQSLETVHFQNGQYLAFNDLHAYIS